MMRLLILLCTSICSMYANTADQLFVDKKYGQALEQYELYEQPSSAVLQRMSQCALAVQKPAYALLYAYRARRLCSWTNYYKLSRIIAGIARANGVQAETNPIQSIIKDLVCAVPLLWWQLFFLALWLLLLWRGLYWIRKRSWVKFLLLCALILFAGLLAWYCSSRRGQHIVVAADACDVRSGPDEQYAKLGVLSPAVAACVEQSYVRAKHTFLKIQTRDMRGWINAEGVLTV